MERVYVDLTPSSSKAALKIMKESVYWQKALTEALEDPDFNLAEEEIAERLNRGQLGSSSLGVFLTAAGLELENPSLDPPTRDCYYNFIRELKKALKILPHLGPKSTYIYSASFTVKNDPPNAHLVFYADQKLTTRELLEKLYTVLYDLDEESWKENREATRYPTLESYLATFTVADLARGLLEQGMTHCAVTSVHEYQNRLLPETQYLKISDYLAVEGQKSLRYYNKLIRDKAPLTLKKRGRHFTIKYADPPLFKEKLKEKLIEEIFEYLYCGDPLELADTMEVIYAILKEEGLTFEQLEDFRLQKLEKRGGFTKRIILVDAEK